MATRSTIAVRHEDGTVSQIYCHYDGYLSHNGKLLMEHHNTLLGAEFLVSKGDLSVLGSRVTPDPDRGIHTFDAPQSGVCVYYRDCGDADTKPRRFDTRKDFIDNCQREEYNYYFNGDWWEVEFDDDFIPLTIALAIERDAEGCE